MVRRRVGWPTSRQASGESCVHAVVGQHPDGLELLVGQQVGFVEHQDRGAAAFVAFGGEAPGWPG